MAVLPINSVSVNANQYSFTGKKDKNSHKANPLATVPVIIMLVMAPMAEGKQPAQFVPIDSKQLTELVAQASAVAPKAYEYTQNPQKEAPLGIEYLSLRKTQKVLPCLGNEQPANLLFTTSHGDNEENRVTRIYYVENDYDKSQYKEPPYIQSLIYHDLGEKSFLGIKTFERFRVKKGDDYERKIFISEVKLDDEAAQYLIDFLAGDTNFKNSTNIKFEETTSPRVQPPKVY